MLNQWINDDTLMLCDRVAEWPEALARCAEPLQRAGIITTDYLSAIIRQHQKLGPYYVLAPGLAMPHARPEEGAVGQGLSLLKLGTGVAFGCEEFDPVNLVIMLGAPDSQQHIEMISALADLFSSSEDLQALHQATTAEEIKAIIARF